MLLWPSRKPVSGSHYPREHWCCWQIGFQFLPSRLPAVWSGASYLTSHKPQFLQILTETLKVPEGFGYNTVGDAFGIIALYPATLQQVAMIIIVSYHPHPLQGHGRLGETCQKGIQMSWLPGGNAFLINTVKGTEKESGDFG